MGDSVLDKAKLRLDALEKEAADLRAFIKMYVKLSATDRFPAPMAKNVDKDISVSGSDLLWAVDNDQFSSRDEIVQAARDVLRKIAPRPMLIGDLYDALRDRGIKISGKNPKGNLSAKLAPPDDIVYVKNEGWYYRPDENGGTAGSSDANTGSVSGAPGVLNPNPSPFG